MKEIQEDIVWFDLSEYGSFMPAPYTQKTITTVYKQATEMMLDPGVTDTDQYLHQWRAVLTDHKDMNTIEWRLMVLLHIAVCGLKGISAPIILADD